MRGHSGGYASAKVPRSEMKPPPASAIKTKNRTETMQDTKTLKRHDLPMQYAPVLTVTPGSVDPIELALYEAVLHEKRVLVLYPLMNDIPPMPDLDEYSFSNEISMVTRSYGNQSITTTNGGKIRILAANLKGGSPWNADLAIVVQTTAATPTSLGLV